MYICVIIDYSKFFCWVLIYLPSTCMSIHSYIFAFGSCLLFFLLFSFRNKFFDFPLGFVRFSNANALEENGFNAIY